MPGGSAIVAKKGTSAMSESAQAFLAARDLLLLHRRDIAAAQAAFRWPTLDRFNWALDYFDRMAAGNDAPAMPSVLREE